MKRYDYLIVGSGLFGATCANLLSKQGKKILVIDKRNNIGGNIYCEKINGINVHKYGAHIFHTSDDKVWKYVNSFATFNSFTNSPIAIYKNQVYNLPFNMNTFSKIWKDVITPTDALRHINEEKKEIKTEPKNFEEQAISLVGRTIYEKLIREYTEKQWGKRCIDLPTFIIKRLPVRLTYDNNYFNDKYQGIPIGGYTKLVETMLDGVEIKLNTDFFSDKSLKSIANKIIYTGAIDEYFDYQLGELEYRSLEFENKILNIENFQGNAIVNYTSRNVKYTRIIEHKHFEKVENNPKTVITYEYPLKYQRNMERFYPINDEKNNLLRQQYIELASKEKNVYFGGRLGNYKYYDMDDVIKDAMHLCKNRIDNTNHINN